MFKHLNRIPARKPQQLMNWLAQQSKIFTWCSTNAEILYCSSHEITEIPICEFAGCNNKKSFISIKLGYKNGCCKQHNRVLTNISRYGCENPFQNVYIQNKQKQTVLDRYGSKDYFSTAHFRQTIDNSGQKDKIQESIKATNIAKYGTAYPFQRKQIQEKCKETIQYKYGSYAGLHEFSQPSRVATNLIKYGAEHHFSDIEIQENIKDTIRAKYGVDNPMQSVDVKSDIHAATHARKCDQYSDLSLLTPVSEFHGVSSENEYTWNCGKCHHEFFSSLENGKSPRCPQCNPKQRSLMELEFMQDVLHDIRFSRNYLKMRYADGSRFELDFLLPDHNIAIELNGNFWHSSAAGKTHEYHLKKTLVCQQHEIQLLHFFEDEIKNMPDVVRSMVRTKCCIFLDRIDASQCEVSSISETDAIIFLQNNMLEFSGLPPHSYIVGLKHQDKLVSVLVVDLETHRIVYDCVHIDTEIDGGFEKLFESYLTFHSPEKVIVLVNRRFDSGESYTKYGFKIVGGVEPRCFYLGKKKLVRDLKNNVDSTSKIWDCGLLEMQLKI